MKDISQRLYNDNIQKLNGTVHSVVFYSLETGYTVLNLQTDKEIVSVVGDLPVVSVGEKLSLEGGFLEHPRYGKQFNVKSFSIESPHDRQNVLRYLSSGLIKGVGIKTAEKIYDVFGEKTLEVIETSPLTLAKVKGISQKKAVEISQSVVGLKTMQNAIMFLLKYSITPHTAVKIFNVYKEQTQHVVETNPYKLIDDVGGIGFVSADRIALSLGYDKLGEFRVRAGIVFCLRDTAEKNGNTFLKESDLFERVCELLAVEKQQIEPILPQLLSKMELEPVIKRFSHHGENCISLYFNFVIEKAIASKLVRLDCEAKRIQMNSEQNIALFEQQNDIMLDDGQKNAVVSALMNGVSVITGGPGTGKTTIIKCIASVFANNKKRVAFCAPTGRAAKRMEQSTGFEAKTIHRLLEVTPMGGGFSFAYNDKNPLPFDVVVVDETSMVDINVFHALLKAIDFGTKLVLVGDKDQLPSVGAGNVLADVIASKTLSVCYLEHIYRQSDDSLIVSNAHLINKGEFPQIDNSSKDFFFMETDLQDVSKLICDLQSTRLPKFTNVSPFDIQTMCALKSGVAGVETLNESLQQRLNPPSALNKELVFGKHVLRQGDRVMQTVNNYDMTWQRKRPNGTIEQGAGVFNGDIGFITSVDKASQSIEVAFDDGRVSNYSCYELADLQLAYAMTVHKSQGNEFPVVILSLVNGPPTIINRNLLYTAITRAKKTVVIVGSKKVLALMVRNNYISARLTLLKDFLISEKKKYETFFS